MMYIIEAFIFTVFLSTTNAVECRARFDTTIMGYCSSYDKCQGTTLISDTCGQEYCCVSGQAPPASPACITGGAFNALYSTPRAAFLRRILNYAVNQAGICDNCRAIAAFLAVSATMTNDFINDEANGTTSQFASDDDKYGNDRQGDGSRFRRRGFFGLRGREMYQRLQNLMPQYQSVEKPELVANVEIGMNIIARRWNNANLLNESTLTNYADGTFYGFLMIWHKLDGNITQLPDAVRQYLKFFRALKCEGSFSLGERPTCQYNNTHTGYCTPICMKGLEEFSEYCGCHHQKAPQCSASPVYIRCCLDNCSQRPNNNEVTSPMCSEPTTIALQAAFTIQINKHEYKFLKIIINIVGNKIMITVTLLKGNVELFYSFSNRNPIDPNEFVDFSYLTTSDVDTPGIMTKLNNHEKISRTAEFREREITLAIDVPSTKPEFVYVGIKGMDGDNNIQLKADSITVVSDASKLSISLKMKITMLLPLLILLLLF